MDSERVIVKCLVLVKIYGSKPSLLLKTIRENKVTKMIVLPTGEFAKRILNSLCNVSNTLNQSKDHRDGINISPKKVETQFNDRPIIEETGSKTENRFVIIFKLDHWKTS